MQRPLAERYRNAVKFVDLISSPSTNPPSLKRIVHGEVRFPQLVASLNDEKTNWDVKRLKRNYLRNYYRNYSSNFFTLLVIEIELGGRYFRSPSLRQLRFAQLAALATATVTLKDLGRASSFFAIFERPPHRK